MTKIDSFNKKTHVLYCKVNGVKPPSTVVGTSCDDPIKLVLENERQPKLQKFNLEIIDSFAQHVFSGGMEAPPPPPPLAPTPPH